jgi:uncharacterized protein (TIGR03435 family)
MKSAVYSVFFTTVLAAQPSLTRLSYEVASIKPNNSPTLANRIQRGPARGGRFIATNVSLKQLIAIAYGGPNATQGADFSLLGAPSWISDRFDVDARPPDGLLPTPEQTQEMLQSLLGERFALKVHHEIKNGPVYELRVAKGGLKMKQSEDQTPNNGLPANAASPAAAGATSALPRGNIMMAAGEIRATAIPISFLINPLITKVGRKVVDLTNLHGLFDIELKFAPDLDSQGAEGLPSIFTAIQEQLGLTLVSATGPIDALVVDQVQRITPN